MLSKRLRTTTTALLVAASLLAAACGDDDDETGASTTTSAPVDTTEGDGGAGPATEQPPIVIGTLNAELGSIGAFPEVSVAMQAAVDHINNDLGGVDGHPIELEVCQTDVTPESSQRCAQELVAADPDLVVLGTNFNNAVVFPILKGAGSPIRAASPVIRADEQEPDTYWLLSSGPTFPAMAKFMVEEQGVEKASIMISANASGRENGTVMESALEALGAEAFQVEVADDATDYVGPFNSMEPAEQDALVAMVVASSCIGFAQARQQLGIDKPVYSTSLCTDSTVYEAVGDGIDGWYLLSNIEPGALDPPSEDTTEFLEAMEEYVGDDANISGFAPSGFAVIMTVWENILEPLGFDGINPDAIVERVSDPEGGRIFMGGGREYQCGEDPDYPALCGFGGKMYQFTGGKFVAVSDTVYDGRDVG